MVEIVEAGNDDALFARLVRRGAAFGVPVAFLVITFGVWFGTGQPFSRAVTASILPSVLIGVFGGGFGGMIVATTRMESSH